MKSRAPKIVKRYQNKHICSPSTWFVLVQRSTFQNEIESVKIQESKWIVYCSVQLSESVVHPKKLGYSTVLERLFLSCHESFLKRFIWLSKPFGPCEMVIG